MNYISPTKKMEWSPNQGDTTMFYWSVTRPDGVTFDERVVVKLAHDHTVAPGGIAVASTGIQTQVYIVRNGNPFLIANFRMLNAFFEISAVGPLEAIMVRGNHPSGSTGDETTVEAIAYRPEGIK